MRHFLLLFPLIFLACSIPKKVNSEKKKQISKLIFRHYHEISEEGKRNIVIMQDSFLFNLKQQAELSTADEKEILPYIEYAFRPESAESETHIELKQDTIWRYKIIDGKIRGDLLRLDVENGILYYHAKIDRSIMYKSVDLFRKEIEYILQEYPDDKKSINGYLCYKVVLRVKENQDIASEFGIDFGDTIHEMYVTQEIDLPANIVMNFAQPFSNFFPLEIRTWEENFKGNEAITIIKEIE